MEMGHSARASARIAFAAIFGFLVALVLTAGASSASQVGRGASCKGPASPGSFFELVHGRKVATRRASCATGDGVVKAFSRSCERAYMGQTKCRLRAGWKWRCPCR